ncbi:MAG: protease HtpX [bacterium]|nr:protease HtpX [bacterium]
MFKRIGLFILTNILVITTISIVMNLLGVQPYLTANGIDYQNLLIFCFVWGMTGSLFSLAISRIMAKWMMGVKVLPPGSAGEYNGIVEMVHNLSRGAGLSKMPEVGVYESPELNAFATGPTKNRALVAFSSGLLRSMDRQQIESVAAHEISHIKNGDMVTMTLLQGVVNAFVMFFARVIGYAISKNVRAESEAMVRMIVTIFLDIALGILGSMLVMRFSRHREFRADAGAAKLAGKAGMISALQFLGRASGRMQEEPHASIAAFKISNRPSRFFKLLSSHPSMEERIARLNSMT